MSSPVVTAFDVFLISLGIAPLKILITMWINRRKHKREELYQRKIEELRERYKGKL
ncbi:hypothetical protein GTGU_03576 [Trabulsiella guamensis ATCC 49490]|uniref:Uncharacterized protein n=1 Tax=Trabulsiella guamensis ATCC 49490 TaxID=1005994 RepID=A0A084ZUB4_9ENTR|nr:hypothetical protein [Trabulsiella guamensis]KFC01059.1 hypothetical protein GTGU_03576 [Trabulsiella guamensis ATCC 49490]